MKLVNIERHLIIQDASVTDALKKLDLLASDAILFVTDLNNHLMGSLTDGDIRRGLIKGLNLKDPIIAFLQKDPKCLEESKYNLKQLIDWRANNYKIIPVIDSDRRIKDIINFRIQRSHLPVEAIIMAGGLGSRLRPLTLTTPKPLLEIGGKPIIEYNIDRLSSYGIKKQTITLRYLGEQISDYFKDGKDRGLCISYFNETDPRGTIGAVSSIKDIQSEYVLVMNSDLLTTVDYEKMFIQLVGNNADLVVATTAYKVQIPYGIVETNGKEVVGLKEKPEYTYYSNAGIYIFKKEVIEEIPETTLFNATDLIEKLISKGKKVVAYPILGYWLDIGKPNDFEKAKEDIRQLNF